MHIHKRRHVVVVILEVFNTSKKKHLRGFSRERPGAARNIYESVPGMTMLLNKTLYIVFYGQSTKKKINTVAGGFGVHT